MPRVLVSGDCEGKLVLFSKLLAAVEAKQGPFDCVLCCGSFLAPALQESSSNSTRGQYSLPPNADGAHCPDCNPVEEEKTGVSSLHASSAAAPEIATSTDNETIQQELISSLCTLSAELVAFIEKKATFCIPTYFIDSSSLAAVTLLQSKQSRRPFSTSEWPLEIAPNLYFLGPMGILPICGLSVAFLSGVAHSSVATPTKNVSTASPFFEGAQYTDRALQQFLASITEKQGMVDIFLSCEWPTAIENGLSQEQRDSFHALYPEMPQGTMNSVSIAIDTIVKKMEPRFHFAASEAVFYQRPPYKTATYGYTHKFIALGKIGSRGIHKKALHAIEIQAISTLSGNFSMQTSHLPSQNPYYDETQKRKFLGMESPSTSCDSALTSLSKRSKTETSMEKVDSEGAAKPQRESEVVCITNIAYETEEASLYEVMTTFGELKFIRFPKDEEGKSIGRAWAVYKGSEPTHYAVEASEKIESGGRKMKIFIWNGRIPYGKETTQGDDPRRMAASPSSTLLDTEPHSECWFCLANPKVAKQLLVDIGTSIYLSLAKGGLVDEHLLLLPIKHFPSFQQCTEAILQELDEYLSKLRLYFEKEGKDIVVFERYIKMSNSKTMHTQMQIIPIASNLSFYCFDVFQKNGRLANLVFHALPLTSRCVNLPSILSEAAPSAYFYLELPSERTARGKQVQRFLVTPSATSNHRLPMNFCRETLATIFEVPERCDWRSCTYTLDEELQIASKIREKFSRL